MIITLRNKWISECTSIQLLFLFTTNTYQKSLELLTFSWLFRRLLWSTIWSLPFLAEWLCSLIYGRNWMYIHAQTFLLATGLSLVGTLHPDPVQIPRGRTLFCYPAVWASHRLFLQAASKQNIMLKSVFQPFLPTMNRDFLVVWRFFKPQCNFSIF